MDSRMFDRFRFGVQRSFLGSLRGRKKKYPADKSLRRQYRYADRELFAKLQAAASVQSHKRILVSTSNETANDMRDMLVQLYFHTGYF